MAPLRIRTNTIPLVLEETTVGGQAQHAGSQQVANVAAFLVSEKAGYINGVTITVVATASMGS